MFPLEMELIRVPQTLTRHRGRFSQATLCTHLLMSNAIIRVPTWFCGEFAGILVAPEAVPLFHEDKVSVSAEQLHPSASLQVWQLRAACVTFPRRAKYPPTTERSPCCSWLTRADYTPRCKRQRRRAIARGGGRERAATRINSIISQWAWRWGGPVARYFDEVLPRFVRL